MGVNRLCGRSAVRAVGQPLKLYGRWHAASFVFINLAPLLADAWRILLLRCPCRYWPKRGWVHRNDCSMLAWLSLWSQLVTAAGFWVG